MIRNYLIKLSYENDTLRLVSSEKDLIYLESDLDSKNECYRSTISSLQLKNCQNYIRIIQIDYLNKRLLSCGTNSNKPSCTWRNLYQIENVIEKFEGIGKCPQSPDSSLTYLQLKNGDYYFATSYSMHGMKSDFLIQRALGPSKNVRTDQYNSNWLNDPDFVASIEIEDYVYIFMRETAIEFMNCGQKIYSRVIRLCKHDEGTENFNVWKTFEKARLECSIPANNISRYFDSESQNNYKHNDNLHQYPFSFDEINNVHFDKEKNQIYAIFSTPLY
jgi:semaphorin 5